jgi:hypothetical protein
MRRQALVKLAGEQGDAVHHGVVPEEVAGQADLAATAWPQHPLIEVGPSSMNSCLGSELLRLNLVM